MYWVLTIVNSHAPLLDSADVAAELVLSVAILHQLGLHRETPHYIQIVSAQLNLVQDFGTNFNHLVGLKLKRGNINVISLDKHNSIFAVTSFLDSP